MKPAASLVISDLNNNHDNGTDASSALPTIETPVIETPNNNDLNVPEQYDPRALSLNLLQYFETKYLNYNLEELRKIASKLKIIYTTDDVTHLLKELPEAKPIIGTGKNSE